MSNAVEASHAAYSLEGDDRQWLEQLTSHVGPLLDRGRGTVSFEWRTTGSGLVEAQEFALSGGRDGDIEMLDDLLRNLDPGRVELAYGTPYAYRSLSEIAQNHPEISDLREDEDMQRLSHHRDVFDFEMLRVDMGGGRGLMFSVMRDEISGIHEARRALWERVGAHIAAGARLRNRLEGSRLNEATMVFDQRTDSIDHLSETMKSAARRTRLLELIRARQHASDLAESRPLEAMNLWQGLVDGEWSFLDIVDDDGRKFTILRENPVDVRTGFELSERERQVAFLFGRGHHTKLVAYELGLKPSTVRSHLRSALQKLNLDDATALSRLASIVRTDKTRSSLGELDVLALAEEPLHMPEELTDAERDVAALAYRGFSNREIARKRRTSERTVANQLASIFRKLEISSRQDLIHELAERQVDRGGDIVGSGDGGI